MLNNAGLMESTQSGKAFGFLWGMLGFGGLQAIVFAFVQKSVKIRITVVDFLLFAFCLTEIFSFVMHPGDSLSMMTFYGLMAFYLAVRILHVRYVIYLILAVVFSGTIEAIYGNLQLWGYYPSNHGIFRMTGNFFNPGPFAGYLAAVFPLSLGIYLWGLPFRNSGISRFCEKVAVYSKTIKSGTSRKLAEFHFINSFRFSKSTTGEQEKEPGFNSQTIFTVIAGLSTIGLGLVLPASRSRAAWLAVAVSSVYLLSIKYRWRESVTAYLNTKAKKIAFFLGLTLFVFLTVAGLYFFKKGSADGRLLIWKVSAKMIQDKPLLGHGTDGFAAKYMNYQAEYFSPNPEIQAANQADNVSYPYNEFLKILVEKGFLGFLIAVGLIYALFFGKNVRIKEWQVLRVILSGGIISTVVFAQFSYPSEILPIKMVFVMFVAVLANHQHPVFSRSFKATKDTSAKYKESNYLYSIAKFSLAGLVLFAVYPAATTVNKLQHAYKTWKDASDVYNVGAYPECLEDFELAYPQLRNNGVFLVQYGKALEMAEKYEASIAILSEAKQHLNNTIVFTCLGNDYKALGKTSKAEQAYLHAWNMAPVKFYPLYLLAKLYYEVGQKTKAIAIARKVMDKDVKIESTAIKEIQEEMRIIINNS